MSGSSPLPIYDFYKHLDSPFQFEYTELEHAYNPYDASSAHRHDYFEIIFFNRTGGTHEIDFHEYPIKKNSIHIISPGQVHLLRRNKNVGGHVLSFKQELFFNYSATHLSIFSPANYPIIQFKQKPADKIEKIISEIVSEYNAASEMKREAITAYLVVLLVEIKRSYNPSPDFIPQSTDHDLTRRFREMVEKEFLLIRQVTDYASKLNITPGHLNDTVKKDTGKNASEIIHNRIILEAKRLLYHSSQSIKEIAATLHYEDPSYFVRFFKSNTGSTPLEFRNHIREKYN
jgi:AraC family transcriptional regulator, transcriptional activator of pobA